MKKTFISYGPIHFNQPLLYSHSFIIPFLKFVPFEVSIPLCDYKEIIFVPTSDVRWNDTRKVWVTEGK